MNEGFPFFDIILFALIAAFLVLRLRSVLGRRDGHEGGYRDPFNERRGDEPARDDDPDGTVVRLPGRKGADSVDDLWSDDKPGVPPGAGEGDEAIDRVAAGILRIKRADSGFDIDGFVGGARAAFEMIVGAFINGDTAALKPLLSAEVFGNFAAAIRAREQAGERCQDSLIAIKRTDIVDAALTGRIASVSVRFVSDQVKATLDENGDVVDGDPNVIIEVTDVWTFTRDVRSRDPNWTLVATESPE